MNLLETIDHPQDLKNILRSDLPGIAAEIRKRIVDIVSKNGGHLASSLGVVELTIAIHYVFNTPEDKVLWDVGHQAYAHKILTGRRNRFHTIRKYGGLSGFVRRSESVYDTFSAGHSSTSISAGLGIACSKSLKNENSKVIAVIGDGSMTAGLAYEGLNQAGDLHKDLIVILNDNDMSITNNVGALSSLLSRTFSAKKFLEFRKEFKEVLQSLPKIGEDIYQFAKRSEESFKTFITPGMLFEAFNFKYFGPIDGHNLNHIIDILNNIKYLQEPVLIHVITKKGKGYFPAEKNPVYFHGVSGSVNSKQNSKALEEPIPTYTQVFGDTMVQLSKKNKKIIAITAAMPEGTGLVQFKKEFPDRFFDVGIAEQHSVTFAAGMATEGFKPVVAVYSTFLQRAYDQIVHDVCLESLPIVFAIDRAGLVGEDGATHNGVFDLSYLRSLPNMIVMAPKDENELCQMLYTALCNDGPAAIRYPREKGTGIHINSDIKPVEIGKGEILKKGDDILILAIGRCVLESVKAYNLLIKEGISATVVNCRFVKPIDNKLISFLAKKIPLIITVEENSLQGGFGSAVLECLSDEGVSHYSLERIGVPDTFIEHGHQDLLRLKYGLDAAGIVRAAKKMIQKKQTNILNSNSIYNGERRILN